MNAPVQNRLQFDAAAATPTPDEPLMLDLEVWEGPLHVLLELAKAQKVDLRGHLGDPAGRPVPGLRPGRQGAPVRRRRRDYLVMAAWLTYLKSRLLLPKPEAVAPAEEPAEEVAQRLALRLLKLDAVRRGRGGAGGAAHAAAGTSFRAAIRKPPSSCPTTSWRAISTA